MMKCCPMMLVCQALQRLTSKHPGMYDSNVLTMMCCLMALLACRPSSTPPTKMCTVSCCTKREAMALTSLGQVALKNSVWRLGGTMATMREICSSTGRRRQPMTSRGSLKSTPIWLSRILS